MARLCLRLGEGGIQVSGVAAMKANKRWELLLWDITVGTNTPCTDEVMLPGSPLDLCHYCLQTL